MTPITPEKLRRTEEGLEKIARLQQAAADVQAEKLQQAESVVNAVDARASDRSDLPTARLVDPRSLWDQWKRRLFAAWVTALIWGIFVGGAAATYAGCRAMEKQADLRSHLRKTDLLFAVNQCFDVWYEIAFDHEDPHQIDRCEKAINQVSEDAP